jgi:site-specific recombinase XerD
MSSSKNTLRILRLLKQASQSSLLSLSLQEFLLDRQVSNASDWTLRFYRQKLESFLDYLAGHSVTAPDELTTAHLRCFMLSLQHEGHKPGGQHAFFRAIRAFLYWLEQEGELSTNPVRRLRPPRVPEQLLDPVNLDDVRAMLRTCDPRTELGCRDRAVILALLDTGARATEMIAGFVHVVRSSPKREV